VRKLAAIMFTDIVGYTALMGEDESKALGLLQKNRDFLKPIVEQHNGEWLKEMGDGTLSCFTSAVDAVNCAREIQLSLKDDPGLTLRIGIHIGDVVFEGGDVFGDGVNVASRIEPLAEPGGICISGRVYDDIQNKPEIETVFIGEQALKHVKRPVKVYALVGEGLPTPLTRSVKTESRRHLPETLRRRWWIPVGVATLVAAGLALYLSGVLGGDTGSYEPRYGPNSVAVLPFLNLSDSEENEYFSDSITDEILTHLSRIAGLHVISRTSSMQYKNSDKSIQQIGEELGVAVVLEGSVLRAGDRVRITGQLIEAPRDRHLWADNYDRQLTDIFAVLSDVPMRIANALNATLTAEEQEDIHRTPTDSTVAYDYFLQGNALHNNFRMVRRIERKESLEKAVDMYEQAVAVDPLFLLAHVKLTEAHLDFYWPGYGPLDRTETRLALARKSLEKARAIDPDHPQTHYAAGLYHYRGFRDYEAAMKELAIAREHQPNNSDLLFNLAAVQRRWGLWEEAAKNMRKSVELDPMNPVKSKGLAKNTYLPMRNWTEAKRFINRALLLSPEWSSAHSDRITIILRATGDVEEARSALNESRSVLGTNALQGWEFRLNLYSRNIEKAFELERIAKGYFFNKAWLANTLGMTELALSYYDSLRIQREQELVTSPNSSSLHSSLGLAYAGLGRKDEAIAEGKLAVELSPLTRDALFGHVPISNLAEIYREVGEYDTAIDQLDFLLSIPSNITVAMLRLDPMWDPVRDHPRFQAMLKKYE
jgi:serine/threonine-protein kinase